MAERIRALLDVRAPVGGRLQRAWRRTMARLLPLGGTSDGNQVTLFVAGDDTYDAMLAAIEAARTRVWLETYIFETDRVGNAILAALKDACARGVEVRLLADSLGSPKLTPEITQPLVDAGAQVAIFNPPFEFRFSWTKPWRRRPFLQRDHRKILIVDDVGFCGGMNMSEDYAGERRGNGLFRDTHALLEGPCVHDLARIFAASWYAATKAPTALPVRRPAMDGGVLVQILESDVPRHKRHIQRALYKTVGHAERRVWLTTPYFTPPPRLLRALMHAARRGVDVRVLTAGMSDVPVVAVGARHLYGALLRAGVRIFEMKKRTLHAKTTTIDGVYASVGSFNLDRWSFERNLECNFAALAPDLAAQLEKCFAVDVELGEEVHADAWRARSFFDRILGWLAYRLTRL